MEDKIKEVCEHPNVYFNPEHNNFYCSVCHVGMGQDYYDANITKQNILDTIKADEMIVEAKYLAMLDAEKN